MTLLKGISRETKDEYRFLRSWKEQKGLDDVVAQTSQPRHATTQSTMSAYKHASNDYSSYFALDQYWRIIRQMHLVGALIARDERLPEDFAKFFKAAENCTQYILKYQQLRAGLDPDT